MTLTLTPHRLSGTITPPPSKSQAHRAIIALALSGGACSIENLADSQDILATRACMKALSTPDGGLPRLDCCESGSTLRFLIPLALALRGGGVFTGRGRLMERPQAPYFRIFDQKGVRYRLEDGALTVQGALTPGDYALPGGVSSQFITGLLFALPLLNGDSDIMVTSPLESRGYVDMTLDVLRRFGVAVENRGYETFHVPGNQTYRPCDFTVEADWSQAGFWYAAKGLGAELEIRGLDHRSAQGDRVIEEYYGKLSAPGKVELDVSQCPDLVPALAVHAALRPGETTHIINAGRLRIKESDRLEAVTLELCKLGASVAQTADALHIRGVERLNGGTVDSHNDHRIAMMLAVAATRAAGPVAVQGAESVRKSYPNFWEDYQSLGGVIS